MEKPPYIARTMTFERRQRVHTWTVLREPLTMALTARMLGSQERLVRLTEWETLCPKEAPFPQKSHFIVFTSP